MSTELNYKRLPSMESTYSRPVVEVHVENIVEAPLSCLVDSGAKYNRFPIDYAERAGISLDDPDLVDVFFSGARKCSGPVVRVRLRIEDLEWDAPVCFVEDWPEDFGVLGHEGFFRWFHVCFHAAEERITLEEADS